MADLKRRGKKNIADVEISRRRFLQSGLVLTGVSVAGNHALVSPANARGIAERETIAQAAPPKGARAQPAVPATGLQLAPPPDVDLRQFLKLSETLTGLYPLEQGLAKEYFERCSLNPAVAQQLNTLVGLHEALRGTQRDIERQLGDKLKQMRDAAAAAKTTDSVFGAAEQIIYLWYVGAFYVIPDPAPDPANNKDPYWEYGPPAHYFRGKLWKVLGSNVPMSPGSSTSFWASAPGKTR